MQLGFVGLGKMGANMVSPHPARFRDQCVVFDHHPESIATAGGPG